MTTKETSIYLLKFALNVLENHDLQNERNYDNWTIGKDIESHLKELEEEKSLLNVVSHVKYQKTKDMYKECIEEFVPVDKWDEANLFLSTYGCGLSKELAKKGI